MGDYTFLPVVSDAVSVGSSTTYLVTVHTTLPEYAEHGEALGAETTSTLSEEEAARVDAAAAAVTEAGVQEGVGKLSGSLASLALIGERAIRVRRSYTAFVQLRSALAALASLPGCKSLPELPGKTLFTATDANTVERRRTSFQALLSHVASHPLLAASEPMAGFLLEVSKPDYEAVNALSLKRMRDTLALPTSAWEVRYSKNGIELAVQRAEDSAFYFIRSVVVVPLPVARVHALYTHTPNWQRWAPDAKFTEIERVSSSASVLNCLYQIPVICNRDVCFYEAALQPGELAGLPGDAGLPGSLAAVAVSVQHPLCPARRKTVRARLQISVTVFAPITGGGTRITSVQHADPRGAIPASVVNACVLRGKTQIKAMRQAMVEMSGSVDT